MANPEDLTCFRDLLQQINVTTLYGFHRKGDAEKNVIVHRDGGTRHQADLVGVTFECVHGLDLGGASVAVYTKERGALVLIGIRTFPKKGMQRVYDTYLNGIPKGKKLTMDLLGELTRQ